MERLKELINQLNDQFDRKAEHSQLLETTRLLEAELRLLAAQPQPAKVMPTKIAVMMPSATKFSAQPMAQPAAPAPPEPKKETVNQRNGANVAATSAVASATSSINGTAINSTPLAAAQPARSEEHTSELQSP